MADEQPVTKSGFAPKKFEDEAVAKTDPGFSEVQSNHNSLSPAKPVNVAQLVGKVDYNPIRDLPNRANVHSDVTMSADGAADLVDEKGNRPSHAETVYEGGTDQGGNELKASPRPIEAPKTAQGDAGDRAGEGGEPVTA